MAYRWFWSRCQIPLLLWGSNDRYRRPPYLYSRFVRKSPLLLQPSASLRCSTIGLLSTKRITNWEFFFRSSQDIWRLRSTQPFVRCYLSCDSSLKRNKQILLVRGRGWFVQDIWKIRCMLCKGKRPLDQLGVLGGGGGRYKPSKRGSVQRPGKV